MSGGPPPPEALTVAGPAGALEAVLETPADYDGSKCALVCHPHSLYGGSLTNKVVHITARALQEKGFATLRFNFRGVGQSAGAFDNGRGETDDALAALKVAAERWPAARATVAGFSFGAYVAYRVATQSPVEQLITIAPPVDRFEFQGATVPAAPWLVIQGDADEVVDAAAVRRFVAGLKPEPALVVLSGASHFFHGRLNDLRLAIQSHLLAGP